jgi:hypothetical protein
MDYDSRQQIKEQERRRTALRRDIKRAVKWLVIFAVVFGLIYLLVQWFRSQQPQGPDRSVAYENLGQDHIAVGSPRPNYNSNPPTSGPHYSEPAKEKYYDHELPDERLVHDLEHGDIWISYRPGIPQAVIEELKKFEDGVFVIITPRAANDTDIALAAWTRLDKFNLEGGALDTQRVKDFILRYRDTGPEKVHMPGIN